MTPKAAWTDLSGGVGNRTPASFKDSFQDCLASQLQSPPVADNGSVHSLRSDPVAYAPQ